MRIFNNRKSDIGTMWVTNFKAIYGCVKHNTSRYGESSNVHDNKND